MFCDDPTKTCLLCVRSRSRGWRAFGLHLVPRDSVDAQVALATIVRRGVERRDWRFCGREQAPDAIEQLEVYDHCAHLHKFSLCACSH